MYIDEILHACANPHVAKAAVLSAHFLFRQDVESKARQLGLDVGTYVAAFVRAFAAQATHSDRQDLLQAITSAEQPMQAGLKHIIMSSAIEPELALSQQGGRARASDAAALGVKHDTKHDAFCVWY